jgi:DNA-binding winged helix-turn-helix (wHTH) protein/tetratricopeptide (TPR) repeat protein
MVRVKESSAFNPPNREFVFGNLRLECDGTLLRGDNAIHLPPKELAALRLLLHHAGQIVTHPQLKQALWGNVHVTADSVPKCLSSLRDRLHPDEDCIQTVYKRGYRLAAEVRRMDDGGATGLPRLAIMPFSTEFNVEPYLGSAIAEETISHFARQRLAPAQILARDSVFTLAAGGRTAQQIGQALQADLVLTGTVRALPAHFRLRAEMIRVADATELWTEDMLVPQSRIAGIESELAQRLLVRLNSGGLSLSAAASDSTDGAHPNRREAHEFYLRGHHEWQALQRHRMQDGIQHLFRAVELDPTLVAAHIDLAHACIAQAFFGFMSPSVAAEQVRLAAQAIPTSVEGSEAILPALGWIRFHVDQDLAGALRAFRTSAHLPHDTAITRVRSMFALSRHRFSEATAMLNDALRADPFSPWLNARLAWALHLSDDPAGSLNQIEHTLELFPDHESSELYGAIILAFNGHAERAVTLSESLVKRSPYFDVATVVHGYALACAGRREEARAILERLQWLSRERYVLSSFTPALCVALGDLDVALTEMQAAAESRCPWFFQMLADPRMKPLRQRPEFSRMQKQLERMETAAEKHAPHEN